VILIQFVVILKHKELFSSDNILSMFTVPLIIVGTLVLVTTGLSKDTLTAVIGFFGTVVGYLIGNKDGTPASLRRRTERERRFKPLRESPRSRVAGASMR
jgi:hypothetical protein